MPDKLTLYVCHIDEGGPKPHACKRAQRALHSAGHDFEKIVFARGKLFGLFTKGRRPELKALSGQEQLPVLVLPDGSTVNGSASIIAWSGQLSSRREPRRSRRGVRSSGKLIKNRRVRPDDHPGPNWRAELKSE